ncbi:hypothetical protein [Ochrobactrum chromiisoli]|uniref:Uncharacterized protein n=1 Tax=Ochrobactrum chromiisoli TaxID=2993941 RepID=A0ABT3QQD2_9HYPH|nr:hypothetical protein [Ochrobactrum chromiisoli]MCX2697829.1 hypothetical protein [Ochrobactrum chromiisoli]
MLAIGATVLFAAIPQANAATFRVCHGYDCSYKTKVILTAKDLSRIERLLRQGAQSPADERKALRQAVALFEERSTLTIGVRDKPRMQFGRARIKGQMDCVDESTNTDNFIRYLHSRGWLKYHQPARKTTRGSFFDGRYPHWTAVIEDNSGVKWVVDSWFEAGGGLPDIMPLSEWKRRGYGGER